MIFGDNVTIDFLEYLGDLTELVICSIVAWRVFVRILIVSKGSYISKVGLKGVFECLKNLRIGYSRV